MAQYDIYRNNSSASAKTFPYLIEVQSNAMADSSRAVMVPVLSKRHDITLDKILNPTFQIENEECVFFPLDIASINRELLGSVVGNLTSDSDKIVASLDLLLARY